TLSNGSPANFNRVYRLQRGGYYLLNGTITGNGSPLRIVAAKGPGPKPILISTADETGSSSRYFRPGVDAEWRGLYISGIDNLGNQVQNNTFRLDKEGGRYIIDDCVVDGDAQSIIRIDADRQRVFVTNCIFSNSYLLSDPANGRLMDTRGNLTDTLFVQNCTFFNNTHDLIRNGGGIIKYFVWDHITFDKAGAWDATIESDRNVYSQLTNNLIMNYAWEGRELMSEDSTGGCLCPVDSLDADDIATEAERLYITSNNVRGYSDAIKAWIDSKDSLQIAPWMDAPGKFFYDTFKNFIFANNIEENVAYSDAPPNDLAIAFAEHRFNDDRANNGNPEIRIDRNGWGTLTEAPTSFGPADDEYDFDYAATYAAYTHAVGGFPAGDLNWFPDKKAEWIAAGKPSVDPNLTSVEKGNQMALRQFDLTQNYPNPFNPSTMIEYRLDVAGTVNLMIYNVLGQQVRSLIHAENRAAGSHNIRWDGQNDAGFQVPGGMYIYRLQVGDQIKTRKMLLLK
ncbi:T9SS type A sorting domain-containing protein, partial [candidate division KSB1 bacterium]|nr:T9SS type A sorting domain-containing protein [candidate division KSB1 bacterium]